MTNKGARMSSEKPEDTTTKLESGQLIELRWEYWDHALGGFIPRTIHALLLRRYPVADFIKRRLGDATCTSQHRGWVATMIYDSVNPDNKKMPLKISYSDLWLESSIAQGKLEILSENTKNDI